MKAVAEFIAVFLGVFALIMLSDLCPYLVLGICAVAGIILLVKKVNK